MNRIEEYRKKLFEAQTMAVTIESYEQVTQEENDRRCNELRNHIIDSENMNNRFRNPTLQKIWTSPARFKKVNY